MIELVNVCKSLKSKKVLDNISFQFQEGQCIGITGHNGCGKTMLLRIICGLITPDSGEIRKTEPYRFGVIIEHPSFLQQETAFYNLRFLANLQKIIGEEEILETLKIFNLYEMRNSKVKTFSLGMKQRLALCQAFMEDPDILILDEPFNALDQQNLDIVCQEIFRRKQQGKMILLATHGQIPDMCGVDMVVRMEEGRILHSK